MISTGQKKLNKNDVRKGLWGFLISFFILAGLSFLSIFFFFKSSEMQKNLILKDVDDYNNIILRNDLLKSSIDDIYSKMKLLSSGKAPNEAALSRNILQEIQSSKDVIGKDSLKEFKHYSTLLENMGEMITLKNKLNSVSLEEKLAKKNYQDCQGVAAVTNDTPAKKVPKLPTIRKK